MKKIFTLFVVLICCYGKNYAQCIPDVNAMPNGTYTAAYPSSLTPTCVNNAYTDTITIAYPLDSILFGFTLAFDSFQVVNVSNLPAGLNWSCGSVTCRTVGNPPSSTHGCILIDGIPTATTAANNQLVIDIAMWVTVPFIGSQVLTDTVSVGLFVDVCTGIQHPTSGLINLYPNPATDQLTVDFGPTSTTGSIKLYNMMGEVVMNSAITSPMMSIDVSTLTPGVYFAVIDSNDGLSSQRIVIE